MSPSPDARRSAIRDVSDWLLRQGLDSMPFESLIDGLCKRLVEAGVPLLRGNFSMRAYHPEIGSFAYRWKRETGMLHEQYARESTAVTGWDQSPLKKLIESDSDELRCRLSPEHEPFEFPMLYELKEQGATDYFATQLSFSDETSWLPSARSNLRMGMLASWTSDGTDGFSDTDLDDIRFVLPVFGLALKSNSNYKMAEDLLATYLGPDAGRRVLSGDIARGSSEEISAVILLFDLSDFTKLSETLDGPAIIEMLNDYYGMVVEEIAARDGNVLKFMGDGLLAVFRHDSDTNAGRAALDTVQAIRAGMNRVNAKRTKVPQTTTGCTMAVHAGDVLYGNIGGSDRLDFTVIGPAVNTTARLSGMCAAVDQSIIISDQVAYAQLKDRPELVSLGQYRMRGVARRYELFTLDDDI